MVQWQQQQWSQLKYGDLIFSPSFDVCIFSVLRIFFMRRSTFLKNSIFPAKMVFRGWVLQGKWYNDMVAMWELDRENYLLPSLKRGSRWADIKSMAHVEVLETRKFRADSILIANIEGRKVHATLITSTSEYLIEINSFWLHSCRLYYAGLLILHICSIVSTEHRTSRARHYTLCFFVPQSLFICFDYRFTNRIVCLLSVYFAHVLAHPLSYIQRSILMSGI